MELEVPKTDRIDIEELESTDIKINIDYYIHHAMLKSLVALTKENPQEGFLQYILLIEYIENLCDASDLIDEDYRKEIKGHIKDMKNQNIVSKVKLANKKINLLMKKVTKKKTINQPLRF